MKFYWQKKRCYSLCYSSMCQMMVLKFNLVSLRLSYCPIGLGRCIVTYLWVNLNFDCIIHLMVRLLYFPINQTSHAPSNRFPCSLQSVSMPFQWRNYFAVSPKNILKIFQILKFLKQYPLRYRDRVYLMINFISIINFT